MKTINTKRTSFSRLAKAGAFFYHEKAFLPVQGQFRRLIREFERHGKSYVFVGEGLASKSNYGHILPEKELPEV